MDFAAWFEAYVDGQWHVRREEQYSAHRPGADGAWTRHNRRRHQQCLRSNTLTGFTVWTDEIIQTDKVARRSAAHGQNVTVTVTPSQ
jgi:hypothetical protein